MDVSSSSRTVSADTPAVVIPSGELVTIPAGSLVQITHRLGGNFTITWEYGMARIDGRYAAHLGEKSEKASSGAAPSWKSGDPAPEKAAWEALKLVFDPEIPVSIVDLGLIYSLEFAQSLTPSPQKAFRACVKMTLTAPGCGMGPSIAADARERLLQVPGIAEAEVIVVWDPPWNRDMMTEEGKMILGLL